MWHADSQPAGPPAGDAHTRMLQEEIGRYVHRLRQSNDPAVGARAAGLLAHRDAAEKAMGSIIALPSFGLGQAYVIVSKSGTFATLGRMLKGLFPGASFRGDQDRGSVEREPERITTFVRQLGDKR